MASFFNPELAFFLLIIASTFIAFITAELLIALIFLLIMKAPKKVLIYVLLANLISLTLIGLQNLWLQSVDIVQKGLQPMFSMLIPLVFAVPFDSLFIYAFNKERITLYKTTIMSILMNVLGILGGLFVLNLIFNGG